MTFENQNQHKKVRLELSEGVLVEVPLNVIVRAIQEQHMNGVVGVHWAFPDFYSDDPAALVHLIISTRKDMVGG